VRRIIGIIVMLAGFIIIALSMSQHKPLWGSQEETAQIQSDMQEVHIDSTDVDVHIVKEDRDDLAVTLEANGEVVLNRQGNRLNISLTRRPLSLFPIDTTAVVHLPESFGRTVSVAANHSQVAFAGISEQHKLDLERLEVSVDHGEMMLMNVTLSELQLTMEKGRLFARQSKIDNSSMHIESGKVDLYKVDGNLHTELKTGVFEAELVTADQAEITMGKGDVSFSQFSGSWATSIAAGHMSVNESTGAKGTLKMGKGDFKLTDYKGDLEATIDKGDMNLSDYVGGLQTELGKGQVNVGLKQIVKPINVKAVSGDITLELPPAGDFTLDASASHGIVENSSYLSNPGDSKQTNVFHGRSGQGVVPIVLNSSDGNINIHSKGGSENQ